MSLGKRLPNTWKTDRTPFPFVVACGRSGTTLLRNMLDSHGELAVPPESWFVASFAQNRSEFDGGGGFNAETFLSCLMSNSWFLRWGLPPTNVREAVLELHPTNLADAIRAVYALYAQSRGKDRWGDKTPGYILAMDLVADLLDEARFVHLIRDGRNVALSLVALDKEWAPNDVGRAALRWRKRVERGRKLGSALGPERYREIRYETLVDNPEATLRELCAFIRLPFDEAMLYYHQRSTGGPVLSRGQRQSLLPPTKGLRDWSRDMTREDLVLVEAVAGYTLESFGYERGVRQISAGARLHARAIEVQNAMSKMGPSRLRKRFDPR